MALSHPLSGTVLRSSLALGVGVSRVNVIIMPYYYRSRPEFFGLILRRL